MMLSLFVSDRTLDVHPAKTNLGGLERPLEDDKFRSRQSLDESLIEYNNVKERSTYNFRQRHLLAANGRQQFIEEQWKKKRCRTRFECHARDSKPIQQILKMANPYGQERVRDLLTKGFFSTQTGYTSTTHTFVLSKYQNLFVHLEPGFELNTLVVGVVERNFETQVKRDYDNLVAHLGR